jgi:hypothetical protein
MFEEFTKTHPIFNSSLSKKFRYSFIPLLQGLGLPTPAYAKFAPWGYRKEGDFYLPIEQDLQILLKAIEMCDSKQYNADDVLEWFQSTPVTKTFERRNFYNIKQDRPPFPELRLPVQDRINILYGILPSITPVAAQENRTEDKAG